MTKQNERTDGGTLDSGYRVLAMTTPTTRGRGGSQSLLSNHTRRRKMDEEKVKVIKDIFDQFGIWDGAEDCKRGAPCALHVLAKMGVREGHIYELLDLSHKYRNCVRCKMLLSTIGLYKPPCKKTLSTPALVEDKQPGVSGGKPPKKSRKGIVRGQGQI